jgi:hypothetical protein
VEPLAPENSLSSGIRYAPVSSRFEIPVLHGCSQVFVEAGTSVSLVLN